MNQKRQYARLDFDAEIELVVGGRSQPGRSVNISQGGLFALTDPAPAFGEKIDLLISLPGVREVSRIPCIVRWSKPGDGIGLQFEQLRAIEVWALNKLVGSLHKPS
jgi:hypothetical protein